LNYYNNAYCGSNRAIGNCNSTYVQTSTLMPLGSCVASCPNNNEFMFSNNADKVCPNANCAAGQTSSLTQTTLLTACVTCSMKTLGSFCIANCSAYFLNPTTCNGVLLAAGNCNKPIEEANVCIVPSSTTIINGNSGGFGPCQISGNYLQNYVCIPCTGTNQFVDY